jgi:hypothetical protein
LFKFKVTNITDDGMIEGVHERHNGISEELAERLMLDGISKQEINTFIGGGN